MKRQMLFAVVAGLAVTANASYLYWPINPVADSDVAAGARAASDSVADKSVDSKSGEQAAAERKDVPEDASDGRAIDLRSFLGSPLAYSFYIELAGMSGSYEGADDSSQKVTYDALVTAGGAVSLAALLCIPKAMAWHGGSYNAVPEPTSAVLLLLGVVGLALKRKQKKASEG